MTNNPADDPTSSLRAAVRDPALPGDWIDRTQETYEPSPHQSRRVPPSGDVSRDGTRIHPQPSLASRILLWGGIVAASAAATAGGVLAVRAVVEGIAGSDEDDAVEEARQRARARARKGHPPKLPRNTHAAGPRRRPGSAPSGQSRPGLAPRFAELDEDARQAMRDRDSDRREQDRQRIDSQRQAARARARTKRPSHEKAGMLEGVNHSITDITQGVQAAIGTVTSVIESFRGVAGQAGGIVQEFREAADSVKSMLDMGGSGRSGRSEAKVNPATGRAHTSHATPAGEGSVDLRDDPQDDRTHRL